MVLHKEHRFLIDCGEGTQRQLLKSGLGFRRLDKILLTHGHLDHILGLGGLISTFSRWEAIDKLEIWGGRWTLDRVEDLIYRVVLRGARAPLKIEFYEIEPDVLMEGDTFTLRAFPVDHRGADCFGFTFEEKSRRPFLADKAEVLGVPAGPERKRLVQGQAITLADGRLIQPDDVLGEWQPGVKLVFVGDAGRTDNLVDEAHGADLLVIEATYLHQEAGLAREFGLGDMGEHTTRIDIHRVPTWRLNNGDTGFQEPFGKVSRLVETIGQVIFIQALAQTNRKRV